MGKKVRCEHCGLFINGAVEKIVSEETDAIIRAKLVDRVFAVCEETIYNDVPDLDEKAIEIMDEIYTSLGLVVEEIPDCIPDPEGGYMANR